MKNIKTFEKYESINESDVLRLRTMTEKSIMGFGKFHDYRVGDLIKLDKLEYLRWTYFNSDLISYMDNVLDAIGITPEYRIEKPGKDPEKFYELKRELNKSKTDLDRIKEWSRNKRVTKGEIGAERQSRKYKSTKSYMQQKNHGKI